MYFIFVSPFWRIFQVQYKCYLYTTLRTIPDMQFCTGLQGPFSHVPQAVAAGILLWRKSPAIVCIAETKLSGRTFPV